MYVCAITIQVEILSCLHKVISKIQPSNRIVYSLNPRYYKITIQNYIQDYNTKLQYKITIQNWISGN